MRRTGRRPSLRHLSSYSALHENFSPQPILRLNQVSKGAGHGASSTSAAACEAAGVPAPLARLARRLRQHVDRGGPEAPQVARGRCRHPLPSLPFYPVPVIRGPWGSCVCQMPLAGLHCRASSRLPASSQARPAWPRAPVESQPGCAWLRVAVRLCLGLAAAGRRASNSCLRRVWGGGGGVSGAGCRHRRIRRMGGFGGGGGVVWVPA